MRKWDDDEPWPPGEFVDDEQQEATKRFVEEALTLAERRAREPDPSMPPPEGTRRHVFR